MDVMQSKVVKSLSCHEIELKLSEAKLKQKGKTGQAAWLSKGLKIEETQLEVRSFARSLGWQPTTSQKLDLVNRRRCLQKTIEAFTNTAMEFIEEDLVNSIYDQDSVITDDLDPQDGDKGEPGAPSISKADPGGQVLPFPSQIPEEFLSLLAMEHRASIIALREKELDIRKGHAEDCLETVRGAVIQLSWQFKNRVWPAEGITQKTRAWEGANILEKVCTLQRRLYNRNCQVLYTLGPRTELELLTADSGQSSDRLSWLWSNTRLSPNTADDDLYSTEFLRLNWLCARAQKNRWAEELELTKHEMEWTIRFYMYMATTWQSHQDSATQLSSGHRAYAEKQIDMWNELGHVSEAMFKHLNTAFTSTWNLVW
ncbi:hypothetical protein CPB84DRAFT_1744272 [Gymnopilus junonius]|uniref:Uncharacterized protein n=1 Tax=Gymnopilus junonius TaxID=109634 RepID=A0A9P5NVG0_GYMJU|nr:hypothetical protein CPB84DRAFT_1744272 [Gymnopilus junonius]